MAKSIGITVDTHNAKKYEDRLVKNGFNITFNSVLATDTNITIIKVDCDDKDFEKTKSELSKVLKQLELEKSKYQN